MSKSLSDRELLARMQTLPYGIQVAFMKCSSSLRYYGTWGFLTNTEIEEGDLREELKKCKTNEEWSEYAPTITEIRNGYLLNFKIDVLTELVAYLSGNEDIVGEEWQREAKEKRVEIIKLLQNYLEKEAESIVANKDNKAIKIGIYNINASSTIREKDKVYRAFKLSFTDFLKAVKNAHLENRVVLVCEDNYKVSDILKNKELSKKVIKSMKIINGGMGAVLNVRIYKEDI